VTLRFVLGAGAVLVTPLLIASCAAIAGLGDVPPPDGGSSDVMKDTTISDAGAETKNDVTRDAPHDAAIDTGTDSGCQGPADCPIGEACNPSTGACSTKCSTNEPCHGGCCTAVASGLCVSGTEDTTCGNTGALCEPCSGETPTCSDGECTGACKGTHCGAGSCCTGSSMCVLGDAQATCGSQVPCVNCAGNAHGSVCIAYKCGCNTETDCPLHNACNAAHECTPHCGNDGGTPLVCNSGCCGSAGGCDPGTGPYNCGVGGGLCTDCASGPDKSCLAGGTCGCVTEVDCDLYHACSGGVCTTDCGGPGDSLCHEGCCDETVTPATCVAGTANAACGDGGGKCLDCTGTCMPGASCITLPDGGGRFCGCKTSAAGCPSSDCKPKTTCNPDTPPAGACGT
jgi:hypothetical protein